MQIHVDLYKEMTEMFFCNAFFFFLQNATWARSQMHQSRQHSHRLTIGSRDGGCCLQPRAPECNTRHVEDSTTEVREVSEDWTHEWVREHELSRVLLCALVLCFVRPRRAAPPSYWDCIAFFFFFFKSLIEQKLRICYFICSSVVMHQVDAFFFLLTATKFHNSLRLKRRLLLPSFFIYF